MIDCPLSLSLSQSLALLTFVSFHVRTVTALNVAPIYLGLELLCSIGYRTQLLLSLSVSLLLRFHLILHVFAANSHQRGTKNTLMDHGMQSTEEEATGIYS